MRITLLAACAAVALGTLDTPAFAQQAPIEPVITATSLNIIPTDGVILNLVGPKTLGAYKMGDVRYYAVKVCFIAYPDGETPPEGYEQAAGATYEDIFNRFVNPENQPVILRVEQLKTSPEEEPACSTLKYSYAHKK